eukprot:14832809-Alexandrium_andersonii.AAC.1
MKNVRSLRARNSMPSKSSIASARSAPPCQRRSAPPCQRRSAGIGGPPPAPECATLPATRG